MYYKNMWGKEFVQVFTSKITKVSPVELKLRFYHNQNHFTYFFIIIKGKNFWLKF